MAPARSRSGCTNDQTRRPNIRSLSWYVVFFVLTDRPKYKDINDKFAALQGLTRYDMIYVPKVLAFYIIVRFCDSSIRLLAAILGA